MKAPQSQRHSDLMRASTLIAIAITSTLLYACSKPNTAQINAEDKVAQQALQTTTTHAPSASKLGDLSQFKTIAVETAAIVDKGDLNAAKIKVKELELAWDSAESGLKPRSASDWHAIDDTIDGALTTLRASNPNQADCKQALTAVIKAIDNMG